MPLVSPPPPTTERSEIACAKHSPKGAEGSKLARIFYALLKHRRPYHEQRIAGTPEAQTQKRRQRLEKQAAKLGLTLTPLPATAM